MIRKNKFKSWTICLGLLLTLFIQPTSRATDSMQFKVLASEPVDGTYLSAYHEIEEIFDNDSRLILIAEPQDLSKERYALRIQIYNSKGDRIHDEQKEAIKRLGKEKPYIQHSIDLNNELKSKLTPGLVILQLEIDGKPCLAKQLTYYGQSTLQKKTAKLVLLPFYSTTNQFFESKSKSAVLNTFSDALKCEIQRYFSDIIPADISAKDISGANVKNCFENESCRNNINKIFGESIFISGNVSLPAADTTWYAADREGFLEIFLFDARRNQTKKFRSTFLIRHGDAPAMIMKLLLAEILVKQGMVLYFRSL